MPDLLKISGFAVLTFLAWDVQAQPVTDSATDVSVAKEVIVLGRLQGPPLWEVSKGEHKLMLFGLPDMVPKKLQWDSIKVERVLGSADVILTPPGAGVEAEDKLGPFKAVGLIRQYRKMRKLDNKKTLDELVNPELFLRITALQKHYGPKSEGLHKLRPFLIAAKLTEAAMDDTGLEDAGKISGKISRLVKKLPEPLPTVNSTVTIKVDPATFMQDLDATPWEAELGCLESVVDTLESDIVERRERAISWSYGEMAELYALNYPDPAADCTSALFSNRQLKELEEQSKSLWLENAETVLGEYALGFGTLGMNELLRSDGVLAQLEARGYAVRRP